MAMRLIPLILILFLMAACHEKHDIRLDGLEELMTIAPDSALNILQELPESTLTTDFDKARYAMLLMMAKDKCYLPLQPDSALLWANEVFHKRKDLKNEMKSRYYAGLAYRHVQDYRKALWETLNAIDCSHEAADTFWMGRAHNLAFEIYSLTYDYHNAAIEADKAAIYYNKIGATLFYKYALLDKCYSLNSTIDPITKLPSEEGMPLLDSLIASEQQSEDKSFLAACLLQKSSILSIANKDKLSKSLLDSTFTLTQEEFAIKQALPIQAQNKLNNNENPLNEISEFENLLENLEDTLVVLALKKQYAIDKHNWEEAIILSDSILQYAQYILGDKSFNSISEIALLYNKAISERRAKEINALHNKHRFITWLSILLILSVIVVGYCYRRHNQRKQEKIMAQIFDLSTERDLLKHLMDTQEGVMTENAILKEELQNLVPIKSENIRLKQELISHDQLLTEVEALQRKLKNQEKSISKDIQTSSINLSLERSEFIGTRIDTVCALARELEASCTNPALQKSLYNNLMVEVKQLRSSQYKKKITSKVNILHNNILVRMKEQLPKVTTDDIIWLGLEILGCRPSTICFLLNMEKSTFYSKRARLKTYIERSNIPDKDEFLLFFPQRKKQTLNINSQEI